MLDLVSDKRRLVGLGDADASRFLGLGAIKVLAVRHDRLIVVDSRIPLKGLSLR